MLSYLLLLWGLFRFIWRCLSWTTERNDNNDDMVLEEEALEEEALEEDEEEDDDEEATTTSTCVLNGTTLAGRLVCTKLKETGVL